MFLSISKTSAPYRLAAAFWATATTAEAKALYRELSATAITTAKAIAHGLLYYLTLTVWGAVLAIGWCRSDAPRLMLEIRTATQSARNSGPFAAIANYGDMLTQWAARAIAKLRGSLMSQAAE